MRIQRDLHISSPRKHDQTLRSFSLSLSLSLLSWHQQELHLIWALTRTSSFAANLQGRRRRVCPQAICELLQRSSRKNRKSFSTSPRRRERGQQPIFSGRLEEFFCCKISFLTKTRRSFAAAGWRSRRRRRRRRRRKKK